MGLQAIEVREFAQFGAEQAIILRQSARVVALHINDMSALNPHA
jgi:hypothetical protein